jgi:hypothetical protein
MQTIFESKSYRTRFEQLVYKLTQASGRIPALALQCQSVAQNLKGISKSYESMRW